jgi:hypothetical protein
MLVFSIIFAVATIGTYLVIFGLCCMAAIANRHAERHYREAQARQAAAPLDPS